MRVGDMHVERIHTQGLTRLCHLLEDELHNVDMAEAEKDAKRNELKTKRRDYTGYDDDEFEPGMQGMKRAVLAKYDEDIDGPPKTVSFPQISDMYDLLTVSSGLPPWWRTRGVHCTAYQDGY
jgi:hypothetical protein